MRTRERERERDRLCVRTQEREREIDGLPQDRWDKASKVQNDRLTVPTTKIIIEFSSQTWVHTRMHTNKKNNEKEHSLLINKKRLPWPSTIDPTVQST